MKKAAYAPLLTLVVVFLGSSMSLAQDTAPDAAPVPPSPPCATDSHRQFDFWVGDWQVETPTGQAAGTNRIEKILNDCVLLENWQGAGGSIGKSFNMFYAADGTWRQTWVDGAGTRLDLVGSLEGKDMVLRGETPGQNGGTARHEIRWSPLDDGRVRQHWKVSNDDGETWTDAFIGLYTRR